MLKALRIPTSALQSQSFGARFYTGGHNHVNLSYQLHEPPAAGRNNPPVLMMHGLFGSKQNFRSISKVLAKELKRPVYALDARNHGESTHRKIHDYESMAEDTEHFIITHKLHDVTLIGHSMGAKTAMAVALRSPDLVANIVAVDNAPIEAMLSSNFGRYVQAMKRIEREKVTKQKDADAILQDEEKDITVRQFLLTNLTRDEGSSVLKFRVPVDILGKSLDNLATFPFHPDKVQFKKPALFVRGTRSHYVPDETIPIIGRFFPKFRMKDIDAGHWVISEKPQEFKDAVVEFLSDTE